MDWLTPNSPGVFQLCFWPQIAPGYLGGGLPCFSSALWCQYPVTLCQRFPNIRQSRFLTACSRLEKLVLPSIFDTSFILDDVKLTDLSNNQQFWLKELTFWGIKTYSDPSYIFSGDQNSLNPQDLHLVPTCHITNNVEAPQTIQWTFL